MTNEKLLREVREAACSCDLMAGWTCHFCRELLPELRKALCRGQKKKPKSGRLDPPCDARAYAEYFRSGGSDFR